MTLPPHIVSLAAAAKKKQSSLADAQGRYNRSTDATAQKCLDRRNMARADYMIACRALIDAVLAEGKKDGTKL